MARRIHRPAAASGRTAAGGLAHDPQMRASRGACHAAKAAVHVRLTKSTEVSVLTKVATKKQQRSERIMLEHVRGETVRAIAEREHVTHQRIHQMVHRAKRLHIDAIELN